MEPKVTIVLVNYNGFEDTVECVESLNKIDYSNYSVIVVDNKSTKQPTNEQKEYLKEHTNYVEANANLGFSSGCNIGIELAKKNDTDYILLLNNDTTVEPNFLSELVSALKKKNNNGIMTCSMKNYYDREKTWFEGGAFDFNYGIVSHLYHINGKKDIKEITFITGCLMLIPIEIINTVGLLDDSFFMYGEDTDYCCRVMNAGYKLFFNPNTRIFHKESASSGLMSDFRLYYWQRNNLYIIKKYAHHHKRGLMKKAYVVWKNVFRKRWRFRPIFLAYKDFFLGRKGKVGYFDKGND